METPWVKWYEPGVRPHLDYPDVPLFRFLDDAARKFPDRVATIFGSVAHDLPGQPLMDAPLTYRELHDAVLRFANALKALGVKAGDRVAIYLPNCPQFLIAFFGTLKAGGIVAPINPQYVPRELEFQLNDAGAETIVSLSQFYPKVREVRGRTPLKNVIVTNIKEYFPPFLKTLFTLAKEKKDGHRVELDAGDRWFQDVLKSASATDPQITPKSSDTAVLLYTGGTTGVPKGAELTHKNLLANALQTREWIPWAREGLECWMTALPLFHVYAMTTCMNLGVYLGGKLILVPNPRDLLHVLKSIEKHQPSLYPGVPTMYVAINNSPLTPKYNVRSIKACISGAAGLPVEVQTKFQNITGARLVEGYGLTEASPVTHANPVTGNNRIGTIGVPYPDTEAKIMDIETSTRELGVGEAGELVIRGPQVMKGYWKKPEETAKTIRDGWLYTGDIATRDADGFFRIVDRKKDMIIAGGFNIYPRDVEEVLYQHPAVLEVVVAGVPDEYRGETVKAYVILRQGMTATVEELTEFCRQNLAAFKVPRFIEFRDALPKTMVGKILRRELVAQDKAKMQKA
jgi:long-chain acyl-CoA synthetase